jgi:hypothetical protein
MTLQRYDLPEGWGLMIWSTTLEALANLTAAISRGMHDGLEHGSVGMAATPRGVQVTLKI